MKTKLILLAMILGNILFGQEVPKQDIIETSKGELVLHFVGHGTLYFEFDGKTIHIDPVNRYADYSSLPKADIILVTHEHGDHFQPETIDLLSKKGTDLVFTKKCADSYSGEGTVAANGEKLNLHDIEIEVVPAYNIEHKRDGGMPFHPKGEGNGYVLTFGDTRIYVAGDTENIPEMRALKNIDIAFLPMNLPYTMTPEMVANAVEMFKPKILYPYHFGNSNTSELTELMKDKDYCEVRIRDLK